MSRLLPDTPSRERSGAGERADGVVACAGIHMSDIPSFPCELLRRERTLRLVAKPHGFSPSRQGEPTGAGKRVPCAVLSRR